MTTTDMKAALQDAMRVIAESADELRAGCAMEINGEHEWPDAEDKAEYDRRVAVLESVRALASRPDAQADERGAFQSRVHPWMLACFGAAIAADVVERNHRFFEEAAELVQSCGMTASEAHQLVEYTWSRPIGEKTQEVGGVMVTLAALCLANGLDMHAAGETELARISAPETMAKIRAKQAAKPKHSPLPEARAAAPQAEAAQGVHSDLIKRLLLAGRHPDFAICMEAAGALQNSAAPSPDLPKPAHEIIAEQKRTHEFVQFADRTRYVASVDPSAGIKPYPQAATSPDREQVGEHSQCCDTPSLCSSVRRCTANDASPSRECGERQGKIINEYPANPAELRRHARAIRMKDQACLEAACVLEWAALEIEGLRCRLEGARAPTLGEQHSDDVAVDAFASAMKAKMADARANGRSGWQCMSASDLSRMLREHVEKGDPRDVANFCMMLWMNCVPIAPAVAQPLGEIKAAYVDWELVERVRGAEEIDSEEAGMLGAMIDSQAREIEALRAILSKGA